MLYRWDKAKTRADSRIRVRKADTRIHAAETVSRTVIRSTAQKRTPKPRSNISQIIIRKICTTTSADRRRQ